MRKRAGWSIVWWIGVTFSVAKGQSDMGLAGLPSSPHYLSINPAALPEADFYLGLPLISNSYGSYGNTGFTYRDIVKQQKSSGQVYFDLNGWLAGLRRSSYLHAVALTDLLSAGWREGRWYLSGNITEKTGLRIRLPRGLVNFGINGNGEYIGQTMDLGGLHISGTHYREYAFGASRDIACRLRIGMKAKVLRGMENLDMERSNLQLYTDPVTFAISGTADVHINSSGMKQFSPDSLQNRYYQFQRDNKGWALDIGAQYPVSKDWLVYAALTDWGRIRWKYAPVNYSTQSPYYAFSGIALNQLISSSEDTLKNNVDRYLDSLGNIIQIRETALPYTTVLPARINLGARYRLGADRELSLAYFGNFFGGKLYSAASVAITQCWSDVFELTGNIGVQQNRVQCGAGFTLRVGQMQLALASDNLHGWIRPYHSRMLQIRAGITFLSLRSEPLPNYCDSDRDGVPNRKDDCPDAAGPAALRGCPDTDDDGIIDRHDQCPLDAGLPQFKGCPDQDGDSIPDKDDRCPKEPGLAALNGCPDTDGDGIPDHDDHCPHGAGPEYLRGCPDRDNDSIPDHEDRCPDLPGLTAYSGCPDTDGDGFPDDEDDCPDRAGLPQFDGCPDTDGDGLDDRVDLCPEVPGPVKYRGCPSPDRDGDGVPDLNDACPDVAGAPENNGCPPVPEEDREILAAAFRNLEFETGKSIIRNASFADLDRLALLLQQRPGWKLLISGHTDNVGKPSVNLELSRQRALAVRRYLTGKGVTASRLKAEWFGQQRPVADNKSEAGRTQNRRVEMTVLAE